MPEQSPQTNLAPVVVPALPLPITSAFSNWSWSDWLKLLIGPLLTALVGVGVALITTQISIGRMQERLEAIRTDLANKADATVMENAINNVHTQVTNLQSTKADGLSVSNSLSSTNTEVQNLRNQTNTIAANLSTLSSNFYQASGKYEASMSDEKVDISILRNEVTALNKSVAGAQATLGTSVDDVKRLKEITSDKLLTEVSQLKERLAKMEVLLQKRNP